MGIKIIRLGVYASFDFKEGTTSYGVHTYTIKNKKVKRVSLHPYDIEAGIWDGENASGIYWADDGYSSLKELALEIQNGVKKFERENLFQFEFYFDSPDSLTVAFFKNEGDEKYTALDNILVRERPLNEQERMEFGMSIAALSGN